ncbi:M4 family metallopeptidase [Ichthyenterobacterium magnum]|uniref:Putative secreted protein (Por secretion system target) n=1 Tax=Ichthyenterobacterium magnum TaxID=1230530 RepID=A0A420DGV7_9FLAO|nr:M4 family metallopeptidase [Ichthyenterobacterium magnum]RKE92318.1 putative secreted protein (Por secretion system target) [Ichthyenterobacterium magnum]
MKNPIWLVVSFILISFTSTAQDHNKVIAQLKSETKANITINQNSGLVEFVKFPFNNPLEIAGNSLEEKAIYFLELYKSIYNVSSIKEDLFFDKIKTDNYGFKQLTLKQKYNGVAVFDAELKFHFNLENKLTAVNGNFIDNIKLNSVPQINSVEASNKALNYVNNQNINNSGTQIEVYSTKLYVFPKGLAQGYVESKHLVYEVEVRNNIDVREFLFIDAHTGNLVEQFTGIAHALSRELYENDTSNLIWQEGNQFPGALDQWQQNEIEASAHMYNLFNNTFNYASYDGADAIMRTINNNPNINCPNASWNGVTANYCTGTASDDVVAHEWGHAYTQYTSGLVYAYQSGAINESYSDIWGETVDLLNNYEDLGEDLSLRTGCSSSVRWRMGEDANAFGNPIRDMWDPTCNGDPGKVTDVQYACDFAFNDNGGVHSNSGIPNHAYALLVDGGTYNGQIINAIGFTKAAHIFWRAQSAYLTSTSDFAVLADALEASCNDLIGINLEGLSTTSVASGPSGEVINTADCLQVAKAILAVEMRLDPDACGFTPVLGVSDPLCAAATTGRIFYEDWESGTDGWSFSQLPTNAATWSSRDWVLDTQLPDSRVGSAIFAVDPVIGNCNTDLENGIMRLESPIITMPNIVVGTFDLAFDHYVATETDWDGGNIKFSVDGGEWLLVPASAFLVNAYNRSLNTTGEGNNNPMQGEDAFTGFDEGSLLGSWGTSVVNLSALGVVANSEIQFRWEFGTDGCNGRIGWYVDDIVVYNCSAEVLSTDEFSIKNSIKIFPNPSQGLFTLQKASNISLEDAKIYDINGRFIKGVNLSKMQLNKEIDLTNVASGIYFIEIATKNTKETLKLVKQ